MIDSVAPVATVQALMRSDGRNMFGADNFLFSKDEMHKYPAALEKVVEDVTAADIIVCGYAFDDLCVSRSFADAGGSIFCVNPSGAPAHLKGFMGRRKSKQNIVADEFGYFDKFFETLHEELLGAPARVSRPTLNPGQGIRPRISTAEKAVISAPSTNIISRSKKPQPQARSALLMNLKAIRISRMPRITFI